MNEKQLSLCFKALSDETRVKIIQLLKNQSLCACKILEKFNISQPTLSYHMKLLVESNLVICSKNGIWNHYSVNKKTLEKIKNYFN